MDFFAQDMNTSTMREGCIFGGKADICKEFECHRFSHGNAELDPFQAKFNAPEVEPIRTENKSTEKEMVSMRTKSLVISPDNYKTLMEKLYMARLLFLRSRNITANQLNDYKKEAIEHLREIKCITREELENPEASARKVAHELVEVSSEVIRNQQALNILEIKELSKDLESFLNTLDSDIKEIKSLGEPEYEEERQQTSYMDLIFAYGHWCLFLLYVFVILVVGLSRYLPEFKK